VRVLIPQPAATDMRRRTEDELSRRERRAARPGHHEPSDAGTDHAGGVWLLHEHLGLGGILAFVLILLGSWLATRESGAQHGRAGEAVA